MEVLRTGVPPSPDLLERVNDLVRTGGVIAYPTDTIYGLGCDPLRKKAMEHIFAVKGRSAQKPFIILIDHISRLEQWAPEQGRAAEVLSHLWPAPLTIVMPVRRGLPDFLTCGGDTLAFRVPDSPLCRALVTAAGGALTSSSVNKTGEPPLLTPEEIETQFGDRLDALIIGPAPDERVSSTVVECSGDSAFLARPGAFPTDRLRSRLQANGLKLTERAV